MAHENYFEPFRSRAAGHEDELTRAFLVLLRLVPMAMGEFLEQIRERQASAGYSGEAVLPRLSQVGESIDVVTQQGRSALDSERPWLVSVLMTDEDLPVEHDLAEREGGAIYDGVITLGNHVVTVENKPNSENVKMDQLNPDLPEGSTLGWPDGARAVVLPWEEIIEGLANLRETGRLDPTAANLVDDFQRYVFEHFEYLNPYPTFEACRDSRLLLNRRCGQILQTVGGQERLKQHQNRRYYLRMPGSQVPMRRMFLSPGPRDTNAVKFIAGSVYPGDIVSQARPFYKRLECGLLIELIENEDEWWGWTNLHLSYRGDHLIYPPREQKLKSYLQYWDDRFDEIRRVYGPDEMRDAVERLREDGWLSKDEIRQFDEKFAETNRDFMEICPGVKIETRWPLPEAREFDDGHERFAAAFEERMERVLALWAQDLSEPYVADAGSE